LTFYCAWILERVESSLYIKWINFWNKWKWKKISFFSAKKYNNYRNASIKRPGRLLIFLIFKETSIRAY